MNDGAILLIIGIVTGFVWGVCLTGLAALKIRERAAKWAYEEGRRKGNTQEITPSSNSAR